jgi:GTP-binding protein EngB required for normal cell division
MGGPGLDLPGWGYGRIGISKKEKKHKCVVKYT